MARRSLVSVTLIVLLVCYTPRVEARKQLRSMEEKKIDRSSRDVLLNSLPKGTVPPSSPSKKVHANKLVAGQQFAAYNVDRSVPSPGIGH
ncbi:hypothetical protein A4A49_26217 [Nicotiana attenuata]|uniref:Uncharacterized protein n=1 Tax=Nicotiana attenuata TaxID=49451 RepID=A0A1J6IMS9_NICAT|nr:hypothetical protein A4A49_26217 [Nicotiana attenuata]